MEKLYLRQRLPAGRKRFPVKEPDGAERYYIEADKLSVGRWLYIYDPQGRELALLQRVPSISSRFEIFSGGAHIASVRKRLSRRHRYEIEGLGWTAKRGTLPVLHEIAGSDGSPVAVVRRAARPWGEELELECAEETDEVMALAVALALDFTMEEEVASTAVVASHYI